MKVLIIILVALLPIHALLVTTLKCKFGINTDILRFWKEIILIILFIITAIKTLTKYRWNFAKLYRNNYILGITTAFSLCSLFYIFFPFFQPKLSGFLGFKYDVFFLLALTIGLYLNVIKENLQLLLKILFGVVSGVLIIFLPWYLFGDISAVSGIFGFSNEVSTYTANQCISFSQNVEGQHRFQGSFSGPIRWSVFLTVFYLLYIGYILKYLKNSKNKFFTYKKQKGIAKYSDISKALIIIPTIFVITSIFYSYSKTSILGLLVGLLIFALLTLRTHYNKKISSKYIIVSGLISIIPIILIAILKKDLFLHLGSIINRFDNIIKSIEMFFYNPLGYGLGIAGPASWTGRSIESAGSWQIAVASSASTHKFLPENWYLQILLEQGIIGLGLFIGVVTIIGLKLYHIVKKRKDFFSIGIFSAYMTLLFMANFTHAFEESATSYILFLFIGAYIAQNNMIKNHNKKKK